MPRYALAIREIGIKGLACQPLVVAQRSGATYCWLRSRPLNSSQLLLDDAPPTPSPHLGFWQCKEQLLFTNGRCFSATSPGRNLFPFSMTILRLQLIAVFAAIVYAFLLAGRIEQSLDRLCSKYQPTELSCQRL